jgi:hypothetical protein
MKNTRRKKEDETVPESAEGAQEGALPGKQEQALLAVISHATLKEAATSAGVSETTLWRYMQDEAFAKRLREARRDAVSHAVIRLQRASADAVTVLQDIMTKEDAPASARITAARAVIDYAVRAVEIDELKSRINDLEEFIRHKQAEDALDVAISDEKEESS